MGPQLGPSALCDLIGSDRLRLEEAMPGYAELCERLASTSHKLERLGTRVDISVPRIIMTGLLIFFVVWLTAACWVFIIPALMALDVIPWMEPEEYSVYAAAIVYGSFLLGLLTPFLWLILRKPILRLRLGRLGDEAASLTARLSDGYRSSGAVVPFAFSTPRALDGLLTIARTGRASSMGEAVEVLRADIEQARALEVARKGLRRAKRNNLVMAGLIASTILEPPQRIYV